MRVANELMTLILAEDARNRTNRAIGDHPFLAREVKKLEGDLGTVEAQIAEYKESAASSRCRNACLLQLATLKAELQDKSAVLSASPTPN